MLKTFDASISAMLVMFFCIVIGFALKKTGCVPDNTAKVLSKLENYVFVPALVINTFMNYCTPESIKGHYTIILYSILLLAVLIAISYPLSRTFSKNEERRNIYKYAIFSGNFGFLGNSVVPALMGERALYEYLLFTLPLNVAVYTWGISILTPKDKRQKNPLLNLVNPIFISIVIGAVMGLSGVGAAAPEFVTKTVSNLSACMGPVAMVLTGFVIGGYEIKKLLGNGKYYIITVLRLVVIPAAFIGILYIIGADRSVMFFTIFAYGTPVGLNTVIFPEMYGSDTSTGAASVMISHVAAIITIPVFYTLLTLLP